MRSRGRGEKQACVACGTPTGFERDVRTPRGRHVRWEPCCPECGEQGKPAKEAAA